MDYYPLKNTDMLVSRLSLGTWGFSGAALWGPNDEADSIRTVEAAVDLGVNLIDTAAMYGDGKAEEVLGRALSTCRDKVYLSSKVKASCLGYDEVISECEASLARLGTDHLDLYLIHWPNPEVPVEETMRAMDRLKADGKVRAVAVSNYGPNNLKDIGKYDVVLNQLPYSLIWRQVEDTVIPATLAAGIGVWAYSPLSQGLLSGKFTSVEEVPLARRNNRLYSSAWGQGRHTDGGFEREIFDALAQLRRLADASGVSMTAMAFAFLKHREGMASILVGARNEQQMRQNVEAYETAIADDVMAEINRISDELKPKMGKNGDLWEDENGGRIK